MGILTFCRRLGYSNPLWVDVFFEGGEKDAKLQQKFF